MNGNNRHANTLAEAVARRSYGKLIAFLAARTRDVAGAEDALAEAFARALTDWPNNGVPDNPEAWLLVVARRLQASAARRVSTRIAGMDHLKRMAEEMNDIADKTGDIPDERLGLMFACAHPAVDRQVRSALVLQTTLGFSAEEIAAAFLVAPATMGQRLVRAKAKIQAAGIAFRIPERDELPERLGAVLDAVYAAYNRDWRGISNDTSLRFSGEALWLGRLLVTLLPDEPEVLGMLSLMLHAQARCNARRGTAGEYIALADQQTVLWDNAMIDEAEMLLGKANMLPGTGRYQLEAAIQSAHAVRRITGRTEWRAILALYDHLVALTGSPVAALNRAVALAAVEGADKALDILDQLETDPRMASYQPYWAARGYLLAEAGRMDEARHAFTLAVGLETDPAIRAFLLQQRDGLGGRA